MNVALIIGIFTLVFILDLPTIFAEKKKITLLAIYLFFLLSGAIIAVLLSTDRVPISPTVIITTITKFLFGKG